MLKKSDEIRYNARFQADRYSQLQKSRMKPASSYFACIPSIPGYREGEGPMACKKEAFSFRLVNGELVLREL